MKLDDSKRMALAIALLLLGLSGGVLLAQGSASFQLRQSVIAGGGSGSSSTSFAVIGTVGQAAAGPPAMSSSSYQISSGFWQQAPTATPSATVTATPSPTATAPAGNPAIYLPFVSR